MTVRIKPLVFADEDGVLTSRETGRLKRIYPQDKGGFYAASLSTEVFKTAEAAIAAYQADHEAFVLRCIEPATTPLAEVAMRELAAETMAAQCRDEPIEYYVEAIRGLPTTATPAELLAAALQVPEVALILDWASEILDASDPENEVSHFCDQPREFAESIAFDERRPAIRAALVALKGPQT